MGRRQGYIALKGRQKRQAIEVSEGPKGQSNRLTLSVEVSPPGRYAPLLLPSRMENKLK